MLRRNEVQDGSDKTTIFYQDKPPAVTFTCRPESSAVKYRVAVFKKGALDTPVAESGERAESWCSMAALGEGEYLWSVTPLDAKGEELRRRQDEQARDRLRQRRAQSDHQIAAERRSRRRQCKGLGRRAGGGKVFVNGKPVALDDKARFDTQAVPLAGGRLVFRMVREERRRGIHGAHSASLKSGRSETPRAAMAPPPPTKKSTRADGQSRCGRSASTSSCASSPRAGWRRSSSPSRWAPRASSATSSSSGCSSTSRGDRTS